LHRLGSASCQGSGSLGLDRIGLDHIKLHSSFQLFAATGQIVTHLLEYRNRSGNCSEEWIVSGLNATG
jgi:hypothetical protein